MSDIEQDVEEHDYVNEILINENVDDEYYDYEEYEEYEEDEEEHDYRNYDIKAFDAIVGDSYKYLNNEAKSYLGYSYYRSWCSESYFKFLCKSAMNLQVRKNKFDWSCCSSGDHRQKLALLGYYNFWKSSIHKDCHLYDKSIIITTLLCGGRFTIELPNEMWLKIFSFLEV
jgi:hypothetical protein